MNEITTTKAKAPIVIMRERLEARIDELKAALTDISPEQFIRALISAAQDNPDIQACSWQSLWKACMRACRDQLLPDGIQGAIVPYKDRAQWIAMYRGMVARVERTGKMKSIHSGIVHAGEHWEYWIDENGPHFKHVPKDDTDALMVRAFAVAYFKAGGFQIDVMSKAELDKIRDLSKARREDSPWNRFPEEMYKKTVLRRLCKLLPVEISFVDEDTDDAVPPLPRGRPRQPARTEGAVAALEAFAGDEPEAEPETAPIGEAAELAGANDSPATLELEPANASALAAYDRGKADKAAGVLRKACPGEYRQDNHLAMSWLRGWNGEPYVAEKAS